MSNLESVGNSSLEPVRPEPVHRHPKWKDFEIGMVPRMVRIVGELHSQNPQMQINPRSVEWVKEDLFKAEAAGEDKDPANITDDAIRDGFRKHLVPRGSIDAFNS